MDEDQMKYPVEVYMYDLSKGVAKMTTGALIGRTLEGVWHTGVVAYGREYFFTKNGVGSVIPGGTGLGDPDRIENIGETQLPYSVFLDYVLSLGETKFKPGTWDLVKFNANYFADEVSQFVCGSGLPKYILDLPQELLETPIGPEISAEAEKVSTKAQEASGITFGLIGNRTVGSLAPRVRESSPEFDELQAQIDALRADQLSLEERRNALNLKDSKKEEKKKKKKEKEEKKERKDKKLRKRQSVGDCSTESSNCSTPLPPLQKSASVDPRFFDDSTNCDIDTSLASGSDQNPEQQKQGGLQSEEGKQTRSSSSPQSILKERVVSAQTPDNHLDESLANSVDHSSLRETKSKALIRNKSLKRVSFDEKPDIIEDEDPEFENGEVPNIQEEQDGDLESEIPPLEEIASRLKPVKKRASTPPIVRMAGAEEQIEIPTEVADGGEPLMPKKEKKPHEKGITFRDFDHVKDFEDLVRTIVTLCNGEEQERLREMEDWIVKNEGTWVLAEGFNNFLGSVFHKADWPSEGRIAMMRLLSYGAEQDDIVLILHMDRKDHIVMNYAQQFDRLPIGEQESLAMLFCNLFETASASEWLLYISEWDAPGGGLPISNIRVTTKVAVNALLGDTPALVDYGSALMANLATKEVFDDVCSELAMAILQFFQGKPPEEQVFRCMKALGKFCSIASREVPQLVKMIGPEPSKFSGMSPRVDELIQPIMARLAAVPMF
eukprot:GFUD01028261.1.p1 GENE.GFUD01028261.1~~GFUD01028261.1.p1  ORF type:complete len:722 (-),score=173.26 GFUD01028261.1:264-2429(-)